MAIQSLVMKKIFLSFGLSLVLVMKILEYTPQSLAPELSMPFEANLFSEEPIPSQFTPSPEVPKTNSLLGLLETVLEKDRDYERAAEILDEESTRLGPQLLKLYEAKILARTLDFEKALLILQAVENEQTDLLKAMVLIALDDRERAGTALHRISEKNQIAAELIQIYREYDQHREAQKTYLWTLFAKKLSELKEFELALYLSSKAAKENQEYRDAWIIKGYSEMVLQRYSEAEFSLLSAYQLDPGNAHVQYLLGLDYGKLKKYDLSTQYLLYAKVKETQYLPYILEQLAINAFETEDYALSAHYLEELVPLNPENKQWTTFLSVVYTKLGKTPP